MKKIIIANWKCNPTTVGQAKDLARGVKAIVCAPFVYIKEVKAECGQDCFWEDQGAYTGEVSAKILKNLGVKYVLTGHSERRRLFGETDEIINKKVKAILGNKLVPIFCVGETEEERKKGETFKALEQQIKNGLREISKQKVGSVIVAYEPIWAIGTGSACLPEDAVTAVLFIKKTLSLIFGLKTVQKIPIIYGGSVNSKNAESYLAEKEISGLLVGGASLNKKQFSKICKIAASF